ncbi:LLM class flavin-dependent oxidoreductase [Bradyrhizobium sp. USDA 4474]
MRGCDVFPQLHASSRLESSWCRWSFCRVALARHKSKRSFSTPLRPRCEACGARSLRRRIPGRYPAISFDITHQPPLNGLEPTLVLAAIARETKRIGLIAAASTTYNDPYNLARRFQSLDVISGGRVAWNAVTTSSPATVANLADQSSHERIATGALRTLLKLFGRSGSAGVAR